jgi:hypothetical protein
VHRVASRQCRHGHRQCHLPLQEVHLRNQYVEINFEFCLCF